MDKPVRTTGYSIPLCLWNKEGPTEYQKEFIEAVENVSDAIKRYMLRPEVKKLVKKYDLVESDLRKFSPLWYKKEDGEIVQGRGPMLYPKLMCNKDLEIYTDIADQNGHTVDPMTLLNQKCSVRACVKIESIFIGSKISLQVKVVELEVQQQAPGRQRLICKQEPTEVVRIEPSDVLTSVNPLGNPLGDEDASDEEPTEPETTSGEIEVSDEEPEPVEPVPEPVPTKKAARGRKTVKA
jgi:hypothetical protein